MSLLLVYTLKNCHYCSKLKQMGFYEKLCDELGLIDIPYKFIEFENWNTPNVKDDPRADFHKRVMKFVPMFIMVSSEQYFDHDKISTDQLIGSVEIFDAIIKDNDIIRNHISNPLTINNVRNFARQYSSTSHRDTLMNILPGVLLLSVISVINVG